MGDPKNILGRNLKKYERNPEIFRKNYNSPSPHPQEGNIRTRDSRGRENYLQERGKTEVGVTAQKYSHLKKEKHKQKS